MLRLRPLTRATAPEADPASALFGAPYDPVTARFRNPPGSPMRTADPRTWRAFYRRRARDRKLPSLPDDHLMSVEATLAQLAALAGEETVTWLGHACFLLRLGGKTVLLDPFLSEFAGPRPRLGPRRFAPPALPVERLPPIDLLVVSHNHYDHLDTPTIEALAGRGSIAVVVPLRLGRFFRRRGYREIHELDWGQSVRHGDLTVTALPAVHFSRRGPFDRNKTLWASFAVAGPTRKVWFSGDTAYGAVFPHVGDRFGPFDLAMVGIGAYAPRTLMANRHATPEEAVRIGRDLGAAALVGMHWGTIVLTDEPPFEPPARFLAAGRAAGYPDDRLWIMRVGETRPIPAGAGHQRAPLRSAESGG
jgi:L-ascorbate metabolism protein UlaG (beta-lactamase superfamily)